VFAHSATVFLMLVDGGAIDTVLDRGGAAFDENSLIGPAFGSMMVNFTPQFDWVRVNATYK